MQSSTVRIAPLLSVRGRDKVVDFYKAAFGVEEGFRVTDDQGQVVATLGLGDLEFLLADESPDHENFSPATLGGSTVRLILIAEDPDSMFARAVESGAKEV
jgi:PhnB protein